MARKSLTKYTQAYQVIIDFTADTLGVTSHTVIIKDVLRGLCGKRAIVIPEWVTNKPESLQVYYCVHEATHLKHSGHGNPFKLAEQLVLKQFGYTVEYKKAYIERILKEGREVYRHWYGDTRP